MEEIVKIQPHSWNGSKTYLTARKLLSFSSYGKQFTSYIVISRHTFITSNNEWLVNDSLKGVEYNSNEVKELTETLFD